MLMGTLQNVFCPSLSLYGSVWNSDAGVLHGFAARIFCFFMPRGGFLDPGLDFGSPGRHVGPGTFFGSKMGPEKSEFATETFCHGSSGEIPKPK